MRPMSQPLWTVKHWYRHDIESRDIKVRNNDPQILRSMQYTPMN